MQPYVIRQGDYLLALAHQLGFDADTVWNDPSNAQLQQLRTDPNILFPGDLLQIPDASNLPPPATSLAPGSSNNFVSDAPTVPISVKFVGADTTVYASVAYTVQELDQLTGLQTDATGTATFQAPVTLATATIVFTASGETFALSIGGMDPINTLSGIFRRLQNLGYVDASEPFDATNLYLLRAALRALAWDQGAPVSDSSPVSAASSSSPPTSASATPRPSDSAPPPSSPPSAPSSAPSSTASPPSDDGSPSSIDPAAVAAWLSQLAANGGLADDGTLDPTVQTVVIAAHGA